MRIAGGVCFDLACCALGTALRCQTSTSPEDRERDSVRVWELGGQTYAFHIWRFEVVGVVGYLTETTEKQRRARGCGYERVAHRFLVVDRVCYGLRRSVHPES